MTLDLDAVRRLVVDLAAAREWRQRVCEPYAEHARRVEARVAEAGGGDELRMVALLHRATWLTKRRRSLIDAGVPRRVLDLVDVLSYSHTIPVGEHARRIREAGLEIVCRADVEDQFAGDLVPLVKVLVELDVTDPGRRPDLADLLRKLSGPVESFDWWYGVVAVGRMRVAAAVPHLAGLYGRAADEEPVPFSAHVLDDALARIITGNARHSPDRTPPDASYTPVLLQLAEHPARAVRNVALDLLDRVTVAGAQVDTLRRALSADVAVATTVARVLGRSRAREALRDLITVLGDHGRGSGLEAGDYWGAIELRGNAATALGEIGDPAAIGALIAALEHDPHHEVRAAAAEALGRIGGERAIGALLRQDTIEALSVLGRLRVREAVPGLLRLLQARPVSCVSACAEALARIGAPEGVAALADVVTTSDNPAHRLNAMGAVAQIDPDAAIDAALVAARDPDHRVRQRAAAALCRCRCRDPRVVAGMATVLAVGPGQRLVLRALAERPDPQAERAVFELFRRTHDPVDRRLAARALLAIAPLAEGMVDRLEAELGTASEPVHQYLAWLLGELGQRRAAPSLARQLSHRSERVRASAAAALARLGPPDPALNHSDTEEVDRRLAEAASDPSPRVRAKVVLAFGSRGRAEDLARVVTALDDPHPGVRAAAATAMRRSGRTGAGDSDLASR
jgi:HEAT repeat protein